MSRKGIVCTVADCAKPVLARAMCGKHYQRALKYGDPTILMCKEPQYPRVPMAIHMRAWRAANPDRWREIAREAKVRRRARTFYGEFESFRRDSIFVRDKGLCRYCGLGLDPLNWHLDHVVPLSRGGGHTRANSVAACPSCNRHKADKPVSAFMEGMCVPS